MLFKKCMPLQGRGKCKVLRHCSARRHGHAWQAGSLSAPAHIRHKRHQCDNMLPALVVALAPVRATPALNIRSHPRNEYSVYDRYIATQIELSPVMLVAPAISLLTKPGARSANRSKKPMDTRLARKPSTRSVNSSLLIGRPHQPKYFENVDNVTAGCERRDASWFKRDQVLATNALTSASHGALQPGRALRTIYTR